MPRAVDQLRDLLLALLVCGIALVVAWRFDIPGFSLIFVVMACSFIGGRVTGLLAAIVLSAAFDFFFLPPMLHFSLDHKAYFEFIAFVVATVASIELVHAKKRSDYAKLQTDMNFQALAETCPDCIITVDADMMIQFTNPAVTRLFGFTVQEIVGKPLIFLLPELQREQLLSGDFVGYRKNGQYFDVEATCSRFGNGTTIFLRDISGRKQAQEMLSFREENLRLILETIPGLVYTQSFDGEIEYANCRVTEFLGKTLTELRDGAWINALHPDERDCLLKLTAEYFALGQPYTMEHRCRRFDGTYRWFQTSFQPLRNNTGEVIRWYCLLTDIHDRREAEDSLRRTQAQLSQATQVATVSELAACIVHEISQPLSAMITNGQVCLRWLSPRQLNVAEAREAVERLVQDGKDAREIIKGLRTLFKRSPLQKNPLDLQQIVHEVLALVHPKTEKEHISVDLQLPADLPRIAGDHIQLQQVLLNLVSNAIESMQTVVSRPRKLMIRAIQHGEVVLTEVEDHGIGVSDFDKIFDAFFTTKQSGMGMGLPICRSIIEAHEGRLWGYPGTKGGTVFSFTVPHLGYSYSELETVDNVCSHR